MVNGKCYELGDKIKEFEPSGFSIFRIFKDNGKLLDKYSLEDFPDDVKDTLIKRYIF